MKVFGIGMDIVEVSRVADAIAKHGDAFLDKIFTASERAYCDRQKSPEIHYAARFAAKEAVSKALGTGIGKDAGLHDLEVVKEESGAPRVHLTGAAKEFAVAHQISDIQISLSHTKAYAAANAIAIAEG